MKEKKAHTHAKVMFERIKMGIKCLDMKGSPDMRKDNFKNKTQHTLTVVKCRMPEQIFNTRKNRILIRNKTSGC